MTRGRVSAAGLVVVALVALVVSFLHLRELCLLAGESELTAILLPLSVDGLLLSAGSTLRTQAARGRRDRLVVGAFALGCLATVAGNVYVGYASGLLGALVAAWAPVALIAAFESWIRGTDRRDVEVDHGAHLCALSAGDDERPLRERVEELLADGREWTPRELAVRTGASESYARKLMGAHNGTKGAK